MPCRSSMRSRGQPCVVRRCMRMRLPTAAGPHSRDVASVPVPAPCRPVSLPCVSPQGRPVVCTGATLPRPGLRGGRPRHRLVCGLAPIRVGAFGSLTSSSSARCAMQGLAATAPPRRPRGLSRRCRLVRRRRTDTCVRVPGRQLRAARRFGRVARLGKYLACGVRLRARSQLPHTQPMAWVSHVRSTLPSQLWLSS